MVSCCSGSGIQLQRNHCTQNSIPQIESGNSLKRMSNIRSKLPSIQISTPTQICFCSVSYVQHIIGQRTQDKKFNTNCSHNKQSRAGKFNTCEMILYKDCMGSRIHTCTVKKFGSLCFLETCYDKYLCDLYTVYKHLERTYIFNEHQKGIAILHIRTVELILSRIKEFLN